MRLLRSLSVVLAGSLDVSAGGQATGIREVSATGRSLVPLQTRLRYTTMIVLPDGEEILDVICGDKDFWVISATHNIAHVKPAKEGATTNLNLVAASGAVYSFLLTEKSGATLPDLKVYVNVDPSEQTGKPKYLQRHTGRRAEDATSTRHGLPSKRPSGGRPRRSRATSSSIRRGCSSRTARPATQSRFWCVRSGTTAGSPTSRPTRRSCRRSTS